MDRITSVLPLLSYRWFCGCSRAVCRPPPAGTGRSEHGDQGHWAPGLLKNNTRPGFLIRGDSKIYEIQDPYVVCTKETHMKIVK